MRVGLGVALAFPLALFVVPQTQANPITVRTTEVPLRIPDPGTVQSRLDFTVDEAIANVDVEITIAHPHLQKVPIDLATESKDGVAPRLSLARREEARQGNESLVLLEPLDLALEELCGAFGR